MASREKAMQPDDLGKFFLERANSKDVEGIVVLHEHKFILALPSGWIANGSKSIRLFYEDLLANNPKLKSDVRSSLINGEYALPSTRFFGGVTTEVVRLQPDGSWLWLIDQPNLRG